MEAEGLDTVELEGLDTMELEGLETMELEGLETVELDGLEVVDVDGLLTLEPDGRATDAPFDGFLTDGALISPLFKGRFVGLFTAELVVGLYVPEVVGRETVSPFP